MGKYVMISGVMDFLILALIDYLKKVKTLKYLKASFTLVQMIDNLLEDLL